MWPRFPRNIQQQIFSELLSDIIKPSICILAFDKALWKRLISDNGENLFMLTYRWFLLNFKRGSEFDYHETLLIWELIWAGEKYISPYYATIVGYALLTFY
ncbi:LOW QUALITY PROTEIN: hypothetical protein MXB_5075, partial [Myxobolus squamalis]